MIRPGNKGTCGIVASTIGNSMSYAMVGDKESNYRELLSILEDKTDEFINVARAGM